MIHSSRFTCVLDTNIIYPLMVRDLLFWFAHYDLFVIKWSQQIFDEWIEVMRRNGVGADEVQKRVDTALRAFPDAMVTNYEPIMACLDLPDEDDKHVLAAAIKSNAEVIVTNNLKDFPPDYLEAFHLEAKSPDDFLTDIIDLNPTTALHAFMSLVHNKKDPEMDSYEVLAAFRRNGLEATAEMLHKLLP